MISILVVLALGYLGVLWYLFANQRRLIYHPDTQIELPEAYGLAGFEERFIPKDGRVLQLWFRPANTGMPVIVYFHGNASHLGNRAGIFAALAAQGFGVLALSYRGYGKSVGTPSEAGIYDDARAAMGYLTDVLGVKSEAAIIYGESLGTGVAVQMASEYPIGALVLQAAYLSVAQRAAELYPYIPVKWLLKDHYHSLEKIGRVKAPLLQFHGEQDETIPLAHGRRLHEAARCAKIAHYFPGIGHNDFDTALLARHVADFARHYGLSNRG